MPDHSSVPRLRRRRLGLLAAAALSVGALLAGCASGPPTDADDEPSTGSARVTYGIDRAPGTMDPLQIPSVFMVLDPAYDVLIRQDEDGSFTPGLATAWEYLSPTEFRMELREGVTFNDGVTPFDAEAVQINLDRVRTVSGPRISFFAPTYDHTEIVDEHTVIVHLSGANPDLELLFSQVIGMMVNPAVLAEDEEAIALVPAGAGPYVLDEARTVVDDTYVYTKVDDYWDDESFPFDELTFRVYVDRNAMFSALSSGVADIGYGAPDNYDAAVAAGMGIATRPHNVFMLNLTNRDCDDCILNDIRVREAINLAIDREAILETVYRGHGVVTQQMSSDGNVGFDPALDSTWSYDPDRARELLAEAGVADGASFSTVVPIPARDTVLAEAIGDYLAAVGITLEITAHPPGPFGAEGARPYDSVVGSFAPFSGFADTQMFALSGASSSFNPHASESSVIAELWESAAAAPTEEEQSAGFQEIAAEFQRQVWFAPITTVDTIALYNPETIDNVTTNAWKSVQTPRIRGWTIP